MKTALFGLACLVVGVAVRVVVDVRAIVRDLRGGSS